MRELTEIRHGTIVNDGYGHRRCINANLNLGDGNLSLWFFVIQQNERSKVETKGRSFFYGAADRNKYLLASYFYTEEFLPFWKLLKTIKESGNILQDPSTNPWFWAENLFCLLSAKIVLPFCAELVFCYFLWEAQVLLKFVDFGGSQCR